MTPARSFHLSLSILITLLLCVSACANYPSFEDDKTITITAGKGNTATIRIKNWNDTSQLTLLPGGPYAENNFDSSSPVQYIGKNDTGIFSISGSNEFCSVNFFVVPAKRISCLKLTDKVTSLLVLNNIAYVGFKNAGILSIDIHDPGHMQFQSVIHDASLITRIRFDQKHLFVLSEHKRVNIYSIANLSGNSKQLKLSMSVNLPTKTNDIAVYNNQLVIIGDDVGIGICAILPSPSIIKNIKLQDKPLQLSLVDNLAYIADATGGMIQFDVSQRDRLVWVGSYAKVPRIEHTLADKNHVYVIDRNLRIVSLNMHNKALPITGSFYKPKGYITGAVMDDDAVYVATTKSIEKIRFPPQPHAQISNEGIDLGGSRRAFIENDTAYVADWFSGLHIYDISNPSHPLHISNFHTPGSSKGVVVSNGYAYVGDDDHGLQVIDVHDRLHPTKISELPTEGLAYTLKKVGDLVYLADHRGGFYIIDVKDVKNPKILSHYDTPGKSWAIDVVNYTAYVADDTTGLLVFDVTNPNKPKLIGKFDPGGYAEDVEVINNNAYVSFFDKGFYILDVSKPDRPRELSHTDIPGNCRSVMINGNLAYLAGWESGLNILDISNVTSPSFVGRYDTKGSAWGVNYYKQHAYIWDWWGGIKVINVVNPKSPTLAGQYQARGTIHALRQHDHFLYTANGNGGVQVFDIQNVLNPIWTTGTDVKGDVRDIWINQSSGYLYAASGSGGLAVLDIRNPFYIRQVNQFDTDGKAVMVRQAGNNLFVANEKSGLLIYDIKDPLHTKLKHRLKISALDLWVHDDTLLIINNNHKLLAYSIGTNGDINAKPTLISNSVEHVIADKHVMATSTTLKGIELWQRDDKTYKTIANIALTQTISDIQIYGNVLLVNSIEKGLMSFDISQISRPKLKTQFPATDLNTKFIVYNKAVFFAGTKTISSVQLLPFITAKPLNKTEIQLSIPPELPVGNYHLAVSTNPDTTQIWPNAIRVSLTTHKKPKITPQQFKKLLKQYQSKHPMPVK